MKKFTIFTAILTVVIVVVVAEILVSNYFPSLKKDGGNGSGIDLSEGLSNISTDVLNSESIEKFTNYLGEDLDFGDNAVANYIEDKLDGGGDAVDFESDNFVPFSQNVFLREDQIKSAGFVNAYLESEAFDGFLYKNIAVSDIAGLDVNKSVIRTADSLLAKVYIVSSSSKSMDEVYGFLKSRAISGLETEINETNEFGSASFFMNDSRRSSVAFLTVRIGNYIYGFSYPKEYHSQIRNLVLLIDLEI